MLYGIHRCVTGCRDPAKENRGESVQGKPLSHKKDLDGEKEEEPPPAVSFLLEGLRDPKVAKPVDKLDEVPLKEDHPD